MNKSIKCILAVARSEYIKWITNPRVIIVPVLLVFMRILAVEPLLTRAAKLGADLERMEPFVAIGNSGMLVMLMPCVFLVLMGIAAGLAICEVYERRGGNGDGAA